MTHLSKKKLEADSEKLLSQLTKNLLVSLTDKEIDILKGAIISPTEYEMIKKRLGIILLLEHGFPQEGISKITKTTRQTVQRIHLLWKTTSQADKTFIMKRLNSAYAKDQFKKLFGTILNTDISVSAQLKKIENPF